MEKVVVFALLFISFLTYSLFVYTSGTESRKEVMSADAIKGKMLFQKYNCASCHQLYGLGGYLGPELTTVMSQPGKGEQYARSFLQSGTQRMPDFKLKENEINELITFLKEVDETAVTYKN